MFETNSSTASPDPRYFARTLGVRLLFILALLALYLPAFLFPWTFGGSSGAVYMRYGSFQSVTFWLALVCFIAGRFVAAAVLAICALGVCVLMSADMAIEGGGHTSFAGWLFCVVLQPTAIFLLFAYSMGLTCAHQKWLRNVVIVSLLYAIYVPFFWIHPVYGTPRALGGYYGYQLFFPIFSPYPPFFYLLLFGDMAFWIASVLFVTGRYRLAFTLSIFALAGGLFFSLVYGMRGNLSVLCLLFGVILRPVAFASLLVTAFRSRHSPSGRVS